MILIDEYCEQITGFHIWSIICSIVSSTSNILHMRIKLKQINIYIHTHTYVHVHVG